MFCKASVHLRAAFLSSGQSYGSRRLVTALANSGLQVECYKVRRLLKQASMKPVWKRKFVHTTDSKHTLPVALNVLCTAVQPGSAESGLCLGYHVHPYRCRLALLSFRARSVLAHSLRLGDGSEHASCLGLRCPALGDPSAGQRPDCCLRCQVLVRWVQKD